MMRPPFRRAERCLAALFLASCHHTAMYPSAPPALYSAWQVPPCPNPSWRPPMLPTEFRVDSSLPNVIVGKVIGGGTAVRSAQVAIEGLLITSTTDSAGAFRFSGVSAGPHVIITRAMGFDRRVDTVTVTERFGWRLRLPLAERCVWPLWSPRACFKLTVCQMRSSQLGW